ncbi:MAG: RES family NAD+ phosphorylase [Verrucomicrobiota bacterium]
MTPDFPALLLTLPTPPVLDITLRRLVDESALTSRTPPDYLYTSGYAYRLNTRASRALYGAEDAATAGAEWERGVAKSPRPLMKQLLYFIKVSLPVIDLGDAAVLAALQLTENDLRAPWQFASAPTRLQLLGDAAACQTRFGAVRFPSDAARARGFRGFNLALFPTAIVAPMSVRILDDSGRQLQYWPSP